MIFPESMIAIVIIMKKEKKKEIRSHLIMGEAVEEVKK